MTNTVTTEFGIIFYESVFMCMHYFIAIPKKTPLRNENRPITDPITKMANQNISRDHKLIAARVFFLYHCVKHRVKQPVHLSVPGCGAHHLE